MHRDEIPTSPELVRDLLADQFPEYAALTITPVPSAGTDNALFRLGGELSVRMPRIGWAVDSIDREFQWLPALGPNLTLPVPEPIALGKPGRGYPCSWTICRWIAGTNPTVGRTPHPGDLAVGLARFLRSLRAVDTTGAPAAKRGIPVASRDGEVRTAVAALREIQASGSADDPAVAPILSIDLEALLALWNADIAVPDWNKPPVWIHADISPLNVLCNNRGRLSAVIDFGTMGIGDPAVDCYGAWNLLDADSREIFRLELDLDADTWARGRAWALSIALIQLPYYYRTNPGLTAVSHQVLAELLGQRDVAPARRAR